MRYLLLEVFYMAKELTDRQQSWCCGIKVVRKTKESACEIGDGVANAVVDNGIVVAKATDPILRALFAMYIWGAPILTALLFGYILIDGDYVRQVYSGFSDDGRFLAILGFIAIGFGDIIGLIKALDYWRKERKESWYSFRNHIESAMEYAWKIILYALKAWAYVLSPVYLVAYLIAFYLGGPLINIAHSYKLFWAACLGVSICLIVIYQQLDKYDRKNYHKINPVLHGLATEAIIFIGRIALKLNLKECR